MLKTEWFSGASGPTRTTGSIAFTVPADRRINEIAARSTAIRRPYAGPLVDALPYMVDYPYGCTEQTLNRFLPTVVTHARFAGYEARFEGLSKRSATNLNAQGDRRREQAGRGLEAIPPTTLSSTRPR